MAAASCNRRSALGMPWSAAARLNASLARGSGDASFTRRSAVSAARSGEAAFGAGPGCSSGGMRPRGGVAVNCGGPSSSRRGTWRCGPRRGEAASSPPIALRSVRLAISASCAPTTSSVGRATSSSNTRGDMRRTPPRGSSNNGTWRLSARGRGSRGGRGDRGSGELLKSFSRRCSCRSSPSRSSRRNGGSPGALICTRRCLSMVRGPRWFFSSR